MYQSVGIIVAPWGADCNAFCSCGILGGPQIDIGMTERSYVLSAAR